MNRKERKLSKKQLAVIEEMLDGGDEQAVLDKYKVSRNLYGRWLTDEAFIEHFDRCIALSCRRSAARIARQAPEAVETLVAISKAKDGDVSRKACLDIISMSLNANKELQQQARPGGKSNPAPAKLSEQQAARLLAALAE